MKYFLIAGEASGDKHAANLMKELRRSDSGAVFCFVGGDEMREEGGVCICHYEKIAYMGFVSVAIHGGVILRAMRLCKRVISRWRPDVVILVDYPGFNLPVAKFVHRKLGIPTFYYISPKIWAWKEGRIRMIRKDVSELYSILPFEVPFYEQKHGYRIHYVGNPSVDEVEDFMLHRKPVRENFCKENGLSDEPIIALLPGSRKQEINANLKRMVNAAKEFIGRGYQVVVCGMTTLGETVYSESLTSDVHLLWNKTYEVLSLADVALVTSGTATLEVALFEVPQVVCYYTRLGRIVRFLKPYFLKVPYISLVNLIAGREVVSELIGDRMNPQQIVSEISLLMGDSAERARQIKGYEEVRATLGGSGSAAKAAHEMVDRLLKNQEKIDGARGNGDERAVKTI